MTGLKGEKVVMCPTPSQEITSSSPTSEGLTTTKDDGDHTPKNGSMCHVPGLVEELDEEESKQPPSLAVLKPVPLSRRSPSSSPSGAVSGRTATGSCVPLTHLPVLLFFWCRSPNRE